MQKYSYIILSKHGLMLSLSITYITVAAYSLLVAKINRPLTAKPGTAINDNCTVEHRNEQQ